MSHLGVIDTGVLIGFTIEQDQHHENCKDYIIDGGHREVILPPTADSEFSNIEQRIRKSLSSEVSEHRQKVQRVVNDDPLDRSGLRFIRDGLLDSDDSERAYSFLYKFYSRLIKERVQIYVQEIISKLSNIETEVWVDWSQQYGGWKTHVRVWSKGTGQYPSIESNLLICEGDDPDICLEAHHISTLSPTEPTKIATANRRHFIDAVPGEPESREDNIERVTDLKEVIDLSAPLKQTP